MGQNKIIELYNKDENKDKSKKINSKMIKIL